MKKRILTVLLALALLLGALPAQGWAAPSRPADETAPIPSEPAGPEAEEAVWEPSHWLEVSRRLEEEREGSLAFLRQTLKGGDGGGGADFGHRAGV